MTKRSECSIILGTHQDNSDHLKEATESILHQEGVDIELIFSMVSSDKNLDMIKNWIPIINQNANHTKAKLVIMRVDDHPGHSPGGSFAQINNAIPHITKPWWRWFSGNDILYPRATIKQIEKLQESGKLVCNSAFTTSNMLQDVLETVRFPLEYTRELHQKGNFMSDTSLVSSDLIEFTPFKWQKLENYSYWDFWLRIYAEKGNVFDYIDSPLWRYRAHRDAMHTLRKQNSAKTATYHEERRAFLRLHPLPNR